MKYFSIWLFIIILLSGESRAKDYHRDKGRHRQHRDSSAKGVYGAKDRDIPFEADILALNHVSKILRHCNNPALPFCLVCGRGISCCPVLQYWLENEKHDVLVCCNVRESYLCSLEKGCLVSGYRSSSNYTLHISMKLLFPPPPPPSMLLLDSWLKRYV